MEISGWQCNRGSQSSVRQGGEVCLVRPRYCLFGSELRSACCIGMDGCLCTFTGVCPLALPRLGALRLEIGDAQDVVLERYRNSGEKCDTLIVCDCDAEWQS